MLNRKQRADKIRIYIKKNKLFVFGAVVIIGFIIASSIHNKISNYKQYKEYKDYINSTDTSITTSVNTEKIKSEESTVATNSNEKSKEKPHWRFYWTDAWILLIGGGFCVIMIIRERAKAREKL